MKNLNWSLIFFITIILIISNLFFLSWLRTENDNNTINKNINNFPVNNENIKINENIIINENYEENKNNIILKKKNKKVEKKNYKIHEVNFKYLETGINHTLFRGNFDINEYDFSIKNILGILFILIFISVLATLIEIIHIKNKKNYNNKDDVIMNNNYIKLS